MSTIDGIAGGEGRTIGREKRPVGREKRAVGREKRAAGRQGRPASPAFRSIAAATAVDRRDGPSDGQQRPADPRQGEPAAAATTANGQQRPSDPRQGPPAAAATTANGQQRPADPRQGEPAAAATTANGQQRPSDPRQGQPAAAATGSAPSDSRRPTKNQGQAREGKGCKKGEAQGTSGTSIDWNNSFYNVGSTMSALQNVSADSLPRCPFKCKYSNDTRLESTASVIVFHARDQLQPLPVHRQPHQFFAFFLQESPLNSGDFYRQLSLDFFNISITFRRDNDVFFPYDAFQPLDGAEGKRWSEEYVAEKFCHLKRLIVMGKATEEAESCNNTETAMLDDIQLSLDAHLQKFAHLEEEGDGPQADHAAVPGGSPTNSNSSAESVEKEEIRFDKSWHFQRPAGVVGILRRADKRKSSRRVQFDMVVLFLDVAYEGQFETLVELASKVEDISVANSEGITALHYAICASHEQIVHFLVDHGANVNALDVDGWSPLHCAASCINLAMLRLLVENGACPFATTISKSEKAAQIFYENNEYATGAEYMELVEKCMGEVNDRKPLPEEKVQASDWVVRLQSGTNKFDSQKGMMSFGTARRETTKKKMKDTSHSEYDHERSIDQSQIPLQSGTNKFASQKGMTGFGTNRRETTKMLDTAHPEYSHERSIDRTGIPYHMGLHQLLMNQQHLLLPLTAASMTKQILTAIKGGGTGAQNSQGED